MPLKNLKTENHINKILIIFLRSDCFPAQGARSGQCEAFQDLVIFSSLFSYISLSSRV